MFNELAAVAADASLGLQICGPKPDSFYNGNVHYKMEGVQCGISWFQDYASVLAQCPYFKGPDYKRAHCR